MCNITCQTADPGNQLSYQAVRPIAVLPNMSHSPGSTGLACIIQYLQVPASDWEIRYRGRHGIIRDWQRRKMSNMSGLKMFTMRIILSPATLICNEILLPNKCVAEIVMVQFRTRHITSIGCSSEWDILDNARVWDTCTCNVFCYFSYAAHSM